MTLFSPSQEGSFAVEEAEDEENSFLPCISGNFIEEEEEEDGEEDKEKDEGMNESLSYLMTCLLQRPPNINQHECQEYNFVANAVDEVLHGEFIEVVTSSPLQLLPLFHSSSGSLKLTEDIANCVRDFLVNDNFDDLKTVEERILHCLVLGFAFLQIYCQANYTGPELSSTAIRSITLHRLGGHETSPGENDGEDEIVSQRLFESALQALECDGNYCFRSCLLPHCLLIARVILSYLEAPSLASWRAGIYLDSDGEIKRYSSSIAPLPKHIAAKLSLFPMRGWLSARAAVIHRRLLQAKSFEHVPSLWNETESAFSSTESHLTPTNSDVTNEKGVNPLLGLFYLERGMATHFFEHSDRGKGECFKVILVKSV